MYLSPDQKVYGPRKLDDGTQSYSVIRYKEDGVYVSTAQQGKPWDHKLFTVVMAGITQDKSIEITNKYNEDSLKIEGSK